MAKIIYGVSGDGIGHATRSKVIIEHLLENGHDVRIYSYGKGYEFLSRYFNVTEISGFRIVNDGRKIDVWRTMKEGVVNIIKYSASTVQQLYKEVDSFGPDLIISDFEPHVSIISHLKRVPMFFIDNQHAISLCKLQHPKAWRKELLLARSICGGFGLASHYFITSFFTAEVKKRAKKKVTLVGPILRHEILRQIPEIGDYVLVYKRSPERVKEIMPILGKMKDRFLVYGSDDMYSTKNITFKKRNPEEFLNDLVNCMAVITNGGHSLISEALYLGKPVYSIPTRRDFEQMINAYYLEKENYGLYDQEPSIERLQTFMENLPYFREKIKKVGSCFNGNDIFFKALDLEIKSVMQQRNLTEICL